MNRQIDPELATIRELRDSALLLDSSGFDDSKDEVFLNFELEGQPYFFQTRYLHKPKRRRGSEQAQLTLAIPAEVYCSERRERVREDVDRTGWRAFVVDSSGEPVPVELSDRSPGGFGLTIPGGWRPRTGEPVTLRLEGANSTDDVPAVVQHVSGTPSGDSAVGLRVRRYEKLLPIEDRSSILDDAWPTRIGRRVRTLGGAARLAVSRGRRSLGMSRLKDPEPGVVRYRNADGEEIVGLLDSVGEAAGAPAVVIPPAWGRSKETLLALSETILATFQQAGEAVSVIRFDGIRKRGESFNEPGCKVRGREHHRFRVSQGYKDILTTLDFMDSRVSPSSYALVTFSASSIDGRAAIARDPKRRISGWVCVVGPPDLQSAMRVISGGIDYVAGAERGIEFGFREVLGIEMDLDLANADAREHGLGFFDDALQDFESIDVPITWLHGKHDAWMDLSRVREALSCGSASNRRLIVLPTGHQLRSSAQALEAFQLISTEASRMLLGRAVTPATPDLERVEAKSRSERARLPRVDTDLKEFWSDYLLGRDGALGMELVLDSPSYRTLARQQVELADISGDARVLDLGCGTGAVLDQLVPAASGRHLEVIAVDFIADVLKKVSDRFGSGPLHLSCVEANLDSSAPSLVPLRSETLDAAISSLLLSYVPNPAAVVEEVRRCLRPGGVAVFSTLRRDADFSKIWVEDERVLRSAAKGDVAGKDLEASLHSFLNDAAKLMDLEEAGVFRFWEEAEFEALVRGAGFSSVAIHRGLGDPPQAIVAVARR